MKYCKIEEVVDLSDVLLSSSFPTLGELGEDEEEGRNVVPFEGEDNEELDPFWS